MTKKNHTLKTVLLYIVLALIAVIAIFPLFYIVMASFRTNIEIFDYALPFTWKTLIPQEWTFDNYVAIFEEFHFGLAIRNTLIVVAVLVPLSLCISALGGFVFAFFDFKGKNILFALCLISFMVPIDAIVLPLYNLISRLGLVNSYASLILPSAASGLAMFLFTQFFKELPKSLLEAARIDGASNMRTFFSVVLPMSTPVLATVTLYYAVGYWSNYFAGVMYITDASLKPLQQYMFDLVTQATSLQDTTGSFSDVNQAMNVSGENIRSATIVVSTIPILCVYPFLQKYFVKGITIGSVKG